MIPKRILEKAIEGDDTDGDEITPILDKALLQQRAWAMRQDGASYADIQRALGIKHLQSAKNLLKYLEKHPLPR